MITTQPIEQLQQRGQEILAQTQAWVEETRNRSLELLEQLRHRAEQELSKTRQQLAEVEHRTQKIWQESLQKTVAAVQAFEHEAVGKVEQMLSQVENQVEAKAPILTELVAKVKESIDKADKAFKSSVGVASQTLPIKDYDNLNVRTILRALSKLKPEELELVRRYEMAHKNRTTILTEIGARI